MMSWANVWATHGEDEVRQSYLSITREKSGIKVEGNEHEEYFG